MIRGVHYVRARRGAKPPCWYIYAWRGGPLIAKRVGRTKPVLSPAEARTILAQQDAQTSLLPEEKTTRTLIGTLRSRHPDRASSPEWERLAPGTKKTWGTALDLIEDKWGDVPLDVWNDARMKARVVAWRDSRADTPRAADIGVSVLGFLLKFGMLRGEVTQNAAAGIPALYRNGTRAEIIWTDDDIERFVAKATELRRPQIADGLRLAALTGLRRADLVRLTWDNITETAIEMLALKKSAGKRRRMLMPRIPALNALLDELKDRPRKDGVQTLLVNSYGEPWNDDGFGGSFNRVRDAAEIAHLDEDSGKRVKKHLHDVRGTFCTRLITHGDNLTDMEIASIMGWAPDRVAGIRRLYVDQSHVIASLNRRLHRVQFA